MEALSGLFVGALLIVLGILNLRGNISMIHWYHRTNIREEDKGTYGKWMGSGSIVLGLGIAVAAALELFYAWPYAQYLVLVTLIIGFALILYAQFKFNGGLF